MNLNIKIGLVLIYKVEVTTGKGPGSDTQAKPYIEIRGLRGDTGIRRLYRSKNHPDEMFKLGQTDTFDVEAVDLNELTEILLGHSSQDRGAGWFVEHITIKLEQPYVRLWNFPCKKWFDRGQDDGKIERIIPVGESPPPPKDAPKMKEKKKEKKQESKDGDWEVTVYTGDMEPACGKQKNSIDLYAYGDEDMAGPLPLATGKDGKHFKKGATDVFQVNLGGVEIGKAYKIRIGHEEDISQSSTWYVEKVKVKDKKTGVETLYKCGRWLSRVHEDKDVWRELPTPGPKQLPILIYEIGIATGKLPGAETDARCYIQLFGKRGDSGKRILYHSNNKKKFQNGQVDVFYLEAVDLDEVQKVLIGHSEVAAGAGWYIDRVIISTKTAKDQFQWYFPCSKWFDTGQDDGKTERILLPGEPPAGSKGEYKVIIKTSKDSGKAPADQKVTLAVYGEDAYSGDDILKPKSSTPYQPGQEDEADFKAIGLGPLYKIRIGHANKFKTFDWNVEWVKLIDVQTKDEFLFTFNKWLSLEKASDFHLDREASLSVDEKPSLKHVIYYVGVSIGDHWFAQSGSPMYVKLTGTQGDTGKRYLFYTAAKKKVSITRGKKMSFIIEAIDLKDVTGLIIGLDCNGHGKGTFIDMVRVSLSTDTKSSWVFPCGRWLDPWEDDGLTERNLRYVDTISASEQFSKVDPKAPKAPVKWKVQTKSGPDTVDNYGSDLYMIIYGTKGASQRQKLTNGSRSDENFAKNHIAEFEYNSGDIGHVKKVRIDNFNTETNQADPLNIDWLKLTDSTGSTQFQYLFYLVPFIEKCKSLLQVLQTQPVGNLQLQVKLPTVHLQHFQF